MFVCFVLDLIAVLVLRDADMPISTATVRILACHSCAPQRKLDTPMLIPQSTSHVVPEVDVGRKHVVVVLPSMMKQNVVEDRNMTVQY